MKRTVFIFVFLIVMNMASSAFARDFILVFAGAGMREPLTKIGEVFEKRFGIKVVYDFEGSGRLSGKILAGQKPDIFIPGSLKWASQLHKDGYVSEYRKIAKHTPVIVTPRDNVKLTGISDFVRPDIKLVLGDERACAIGRVEKAIFKNAGQKETDMNVTARGVTVKQLLQWIELGNADASIVWLADARASDKVTIIPIPADINKISAIPVCLMRDALLKEPSETYIKFLFDEGKSIFKECGFDIFEGDK